MDEYDNKNMEWRNDSFHEYTCISSSFFPLKISVARKLHLADPCFPVLEVEMLITLHGRPLIIMYLGSND